MYHRKVDMDFWRYLWSVRYSFLIGLTLNGIIPCKICVIDVCVEL